MNKLSLKFKLIMIVMVCLIGQMSLSMLQAFEEKASLIEGRKHALKTAIDIAFSVVNLKEKEAKAGKITEEEAKKEAIKAMQVMHYGNGVKNIFMLGPSMAKI